MIYDSTSILNEGQELHVIGEIHAPRLILIESSASLAGEKISAVEHAINSFFVEFKDTPEAEYTDICIISFSDVPQIVQPFTCSCSVGKIVLRGLGLTQLWEAFGGAIDLLKKQLQLYQELGIRYWRPRIILITAGTPTDSGDIVIPKLKSDVSSKKYELCVLGLPSYNENLFSFLEVPHSLVQCDEMLNYLNKFIPRH